jgi:hypothetical protein
VQRKHYTIFLTEIVYYDVFLKSIKNKKILEVNPSEFIKSLEMKGKLHEQCIAFEVQFQYNKKEFNVSLRLKD